MFNMGPDLGTERELYNQQLEGILAVYFSTQSVYYFLWSMTGFETIKSTVVLSEEGIVPMNMIFRIAAGMPSSIPKS